VEYHIRNYIPRFVSSDNYASSFGFEWKRHASTQLDKFTGMDLTCRRFYSTTGWPDRLDGQLVLEAGCGAGRFTEIVLATGAEVVSFDYSEAVEACLDNHGLGKSWHLLQADLYRMPLRDGLFDKVFCFGVLQHCPDVELAFRALLPPLKPGGELVVDVYERNLAVYLTPRYWLRLVTRHMRPERLHWVFERLVPLLLPVRAFLSTHVPVIGRYLAVMIPVAYYDRKEFPLSDQQFLEFCILESFDMYSPLYENRVSVQRVREWFAHAGLIDTRVRFGGNGIIGVGRKQTV
jgi:SAM-dependent methyltransferase